MYAVHSNFFSFIIIFQQTGDLVSIFVFDVKSNSESQVNESGKGSGSYNSTRMLTLSVNWGGTRPGGVSGVNSDGGHVKDKHRASMVGVCIVSR